jgi:hypothetical protein
MNIVTECQLLPAITRGQLEYFNRFDRLDSITDVLKPSDDVWEFRILLTNHLHATVFLTEDARCVGTCYQEILPGRVPQGELRKVKYVAVKVLDFNQWLGFPKEREVTEDKWGFSTLGSQTHGLLPDLRRWVVEAVANREHGRKGCDYYGRVWPDGTVQCPICGQPTFDEGCDHVKIPDSRISELRNYGNRHDIKASA